MYTLFHSVSIERRGTDFENLTIAQVQNGGIADFDEHGSHQVSDRLSDSALLNSKPRRKRDLQYVRNKRDDTPINDAITTTVKTGKGHKNLILHI